MRSIWSNSLRFFLVKWTPCIRMRRRVTRRLIRIKSLVVGATTLRSRQWAGRISIDVTYPWCSTSQSRLALFVLINYSFPNNFNDGIIYTHTKVDPYPTMHVNSESLGWNGLSYVWVLLHVYLSYNNFKSDFNPDSAAELSFVYIIVCLNTTCKHIRCFWQALYAN